MKLQLFFFSTMKILWMFFPFFLSCTQVPPSLSELWGHLETQVHILPSSERFQQENFAQTLDNLRNHPTFSLEKLSSEQQKWILQGIFHYQLQHFMQPTCESQEKLSIYYKIWDSLSIATNSSTMEEFHADYDLRRLMELVFQRNLRASQLITPSLEREWTKLEFFDNEWETGGIIFDVSQKKSDSTDRGILISHTLELVEISDPEYQQNAQYLAEFRQNNFKNLDSLEKNFLQRFQLLRVSADQSTELYSDIVYDVIRKKFGILRELKQKTSWTQEEKEQAEKAKKKLYFFGLKKRLLHRTYNFHLDSSRYLRDPSVIFFFHTHPFDPKLPAYSNPPSKQDRIMTFRIGPAIIFDVQENWVDGYVVISGEANKIWRFQSNK